MSARTVKEWYSTHEVAEIVGASAYTVREWCRQGRVRAVKRASGSGRAKPWMVSHVELTRLRNEGILPLALNPQGKDRTLPRLGEEVPVAGRHGLRLVPHEGVDHALIDAG